jgi:ATP-dependent helicase/nuclease subunit A
MARPQFTDNQKKCLAFADNLCVLAGAGSGKTLTLVELVVRLLEGSVPGFEEPLSFRNILAITFTEKAAREMRDRVRGSLNDKIRAASGPNRRYWIDQRRELDRSLISTIHSFCLQVLRRFGPEIGLDPGFGILDEDRDFLPEVRRETLLDLLQSGDQDLIDLIEYFPWLGSGYATGLDGLLADIIRHESTVGRPVNLPDAVETPLEPCFDQIVRAAELVQDIYNAGDLNPDKDYTKKALAFSEKARALAGQGKDAWLDSLAVLKDFLKGNWFKARPAKDGALEAVSTIQKELDRQAARPVLERMLRLSRHMKESEGEAKLRRDKLDFDDLLLMTRDLLAENPRIRKSLKERFRVVLVDEFQDTNRLQADIVAMLVEPEDDESVITDVSGQSLMERLPKASQRLVVFGDPKQSIYRFRGAEVSVFEGVRRALSGEGQGGVIPLDRNFRSQKRLITFFNRFFPTVMGDGYGPEDRQAGHRPDLYKTPAVAILDIPEAKNEQQERVTEAGLLARYIMALISDQLKVRVGEDSRQPCPDDIAVLLRRFTHLKVYEDAFKEAGLPFYTVRGRGFYQCPEVWDLINLLFYLSDPANGPALLGVLRSPLAGLSDETITRLVWPKDGSRVPLGAYFGEKPPKPPELEAEQSVLFHQIQTLLKKLTSEAGRSLPAELAEIAVEETDYLAVLLSQYQGEQKAANVKRFIELTRNMPVTGLYAPSELASYLRARLDDTQDDPEAQSLGSGIQIMTIHQAKGLQFPIVFVPDAGRGPGGRMSGLLFNSLDQIAVKFNDPFTDGSREPSEYVSFRAEHLQGELEEHHRLLYVAGTRAQDHLVFSGNLEKAKKKGDSWLGSLIAFNGQQDRPLVKIYEDEELKKFQIPSMGFARSDRDEDANPDLGRLAVERVLGQGHSRPARITLPVTDLALYLACPRQYYLERMVGLPYGVVGTDDNGSQRTEGLTPQDKGNIFHGLMEQLEMGNLPSPEALAESVMYVGKSLGVSPGTDEAGEIAMQANRFLETDWGRELVRSIASGNLVNREFPFWLRIESPEKDGARLILTGEIDLFFTATDGTARIVDYKYSPVKEVERYAPQVKTYALALHRAGIARTVKAGLYFALPGVEKAVEISLEPGWQEVFEKELQEAAQGLARIMDPLQPEPLPLERCPHKGDCPYEYAC